jgi:hypothetical protein
MRATTFVTIICIFASINVLAQPVYKSVDKEGNVTYSSMPPEDAKQIEDTGIVSQPSDPNTSLDGEIERVKRAADQLEQDRKARESTRSKQKTKAVTQEKEKAPPEKPVIQRHRPIIQQPIPSTGSKPTPPPTKPAPVVPAPPSPSPPVAVPLKGGG